MGQNMKAAIIRQIGSLENIQIEDIPTPSPGSAEVLIDVKAAALNHLDIWVATKRGQIVEGKYLVLGSDAAGVVADVGSNVTDIQVGDEVVVNPGIWCGRCEACRRGQHSECRDYSLLGLGRPGTYAQQVAVPAAAIAPKPDHLSFAEAAALPLAHLTVWRMLMSRARLQAGQTVLVHGIGGGVALAALQLAKLTGAEVIVTSSSDEKLARARELGADQGINYKNAEVAKEVLRLTKNRGVDVTLDTIGAATLPINLEVLVKGGTMVICGVTTGATPQINLQQVYWKQLNILGSTMGTAAEFHQLLRAISVNHLKPIIDSTYPLDQVKDALKHMDQADQFGKIVIDVARASCP